MGDEEEEEEERDEEEVGNNGEDLEEEGDEEEEEGRGKVVCAIYTVYTITNSRPSKKWTTSLQWKSFMSPTDIPIDLVLKKPPRDGRPHKQTLAMAQTDLSYYIATSVSEE